MRERMIERIVDTIEVHRMSSDIVIVYYFVWGIVISVALMVFGWCYTAGMG